MNLANDYLAYQEEINLIVAQNPVECELYSIIASIIRGRSNSVNISVRDVSARRKSDLSEIFLNDERKSKVSGFPDFVILTKKFDMEKPDANEILGAIEAKRTTISLSQSVQLPKHIEKFKNVIYTNGLVWEFYMNDKFKKDELPIWTVSLGTIKKNIISWKADVKKEDRKKTADKNNWTGLLEQLEGIKWI